MALTAAERQRFNALKGVAIRDSGDDLFLMDLERRGLVRWVDSMINTNHYRLTPLGESRW